ncbi:hypothetical protein [Mesorhizobium sp. B2-3-5]|uniref:hypothetical protein n=1 Tax=Mesorhizobium sp. B2-3-5 TaxID=2589958 RepID=UPI00112D742E|nr:hypothetical protein [Mesorhizobium sp. B2-3-5]TPM31779.1 hypothetical protein FJ958_12805 [Mesorhizobium sp. B2-3-5]
MYWRNIGERKGRLIAGLLLFGLMPEHHGTAIRQRQSINFLRRDIVIAGVGSNIPSSGSGKECRPRNVGWERDEGLQ